MGLILWDSDYSVGIDSLDADHIIIASLINHIDEIRHSGSDERAIGRVLKVLLDQAAAHFRREEALLEKANYPDLENHIKQHRLVAEQLKELHNEYLAYRNPETSQEIVELLAYWLDEHILEVDKRYESHLARDR